MELDLEFVRAQFPAFSEPLLQGQAFFENAGGSYVCQSVIDRLTRFYKQRKVQPYSDYSVSRLGGEEMDEARTRLAAILGVTDDELSFGPSTSQNTYVLAQAFGQIMQPGEAIIVTNQDHEANSGPWRRLSEKGIHVREWALDPETGHLDPAELEKLLDGNVRLVCFPHCSNIVGEINPVIEITAMAHAAGAFVCVDGVSYAPHGLPDVGTMGPDMYLFSAYKTYGPHQGLMVVRRTLGELLPNQGHFFNANCLSKRFTPAGPDHAQIAACAGIADYVDTLFTHHKDGSASPSERGVAVHDLMRNREKNALSRILSILKDRNDLRILGPLDEALRAPTISIDLGYNPLPVASALSKHGIMAGGGDFYARRTLQGMGVDPEVGILRISFTHYTNDADINQLLEALDAVL